jgi:hypothetical protein
MPIANWNSDEEQGDPRPIMKSWRDISFCQQIGNWQSAIGNDFW